jgi:hypothetical protein
MLAHPNPTVSAGDAVSLLEPIQLYRARCFSRVEQLEGNLQMMIKGVLA